jgi:putative transposase
MSNAHPPLSHPLRRLPADMRHTTFRLAMDPTPAQMALLARHAKQVTGLAWRHEVSAQVFEEAAVDLGRALAAYAQARVGKRTGGRVGFPRAKRKGRCRDSFRLRNKRGGSGKCCIRVGEGHPRSVTLPAIGTVPVHDDTHRLRRLLRAVEHLDPDTGQRMIGPRAKILSATCSRHGSRWYVSLQPPGTRFPRRAPPQIPSCP